MFAKKAFTIVELMVVVVVIAILAAVVVVGYNGIRENAIVASMKADLSRGSDEVELHKNKNKSYPIDQTTANGKGLIASESNSFSYMVGDDAFCLSVASTRTTKTFYFSSLENKIADGDCPDFPVPGGWKDIATADDVSCGLRASNEIYCWGYGSTTPTLLGQGSITSGAEVSELNAGSGHFCAIANDWGYCWGVNTNGRLGDGTTDVRTTPVAVERGAIPNGVTMRNIAAGGNHTCAAASNNKAYCWGNGASGQLGRGSTSSSFTPVEVTGVSGVTVQDIAAGGSNACMLGSNNWAYCWGSGSNGALGNGGSSQANSPTAVSQGDLTATIQSISVGGNHTCVISNGKSYCWGIGSNGRLGTGGTSASTTPVATSFGSVGVNRVHAGMTFTCALTPAGASYCWSYNSDGQLGINNTSTQNAPIATLTGAKPSGAHFLMLAVGNTHACGVASDNELYCWGNNAQGQIGDGSTTDRLVPTRVNSI